MSRSCRPAGSRLLLRSIEGRFQRRELVQALAMLGGRIRVDDDSAASLKIRMAVLQAERANRDARVEADPGNVVPDDPGVGAAAVSLELRDDLHRAHLGSARDGARGEG